MDGAPDPPSWADLDLTYLRGSWGEREARLMPPASLLEWLLLNSRSWAAEPDTPERQQLAGGDPATLKEAVDLVRSRASTRGWHILEGPTAPDALIETPDALVLIEGKRTEAGPTTSTKWMAGRHQIWRHIDAAWELRGRRCVYGFFVVEGEGLELPQLWRDACKDTLSDSAVTGSFPHRSSDETNEIRRCFLGATTWQRVCAAFGLSFQALPDKVPRSAS